MNRKSKTALLSVGSNSLLIAMKVVVGIMSGSVSIISEAIHSSTDLIAALIAYYSVRKSDTPPDEKHPYGHGKIENVSGVVEALLILVASFMIVVAAIKKIIHPVAIEGLGIGFMVMLVSAGVNAIVSKRLYKVAKEEDSVALAADALHLKADVLTSLGVGLGLMAIWGFGLLGYDLNFLDPVVAIGVAIFIIKEAIEMLIHAFQPLVDSSLPEGDHELIVEVIQEHIPGQAGFHQLRTRKAGRQRHIDFHLNLPPDLTVAEAHRICDEIENDLERRLAQTNVVIHVEPAGHV
jgi:cation diffusion facilitator family transporter